MNLETNFEEFGMGIFVVSIILGVIGLFKVNWFLITIGFIFAIIGVFVYLKNKK